MLTRPKRVDYIYPQEVICHPDIPLSFEDAKHKLCLAICLFLSPGHDSSNINYYIISISSISTDLSLTSDTTQSRHFSETVSCPRKIPSNQRSKESTDWTYVYPKEWLWVSKSDLQFGGRKPFKSRDIFFRKVGEKIASEWCRLQFSKNFPPIPRRLSLAFLWKITCVEVSKTPTKMVVMTLMGISMEGAS